IWSRRKVRRAPGRSCIHKFVSYFRFEGTGIICDSKCGGSTAMADGDFLVLGLGSNTSDATTQLSRSGAGQNSALVVANANGSAVEGLAALSGAGVTGQSDSGDGVHGLATTGQGVYGQSQSYISVRGDSPGRLGVGGYTSTGRGVFGGASGTG